LNLTMVPNECEQGAWHMLIFSKLNNSIYYRYRENSGCVVDDYY